MVDRWERSADAAGPRCRCGGRPATGCGRATAPRGAPAAVAALPGREADATAREALAVLETLPPAAGLAWAYAGLAVRA